MKRLLFGVACATLVAGCSTVQNLGSRAMVGLGNVVASAMTQSTDDLSAANFSVYTATNLYPQSVGTIETQSIKNWQEGGSFVYLSMMKRNGIGFWKLKGEVTIDGQPAEWMTGGYGAVFPDDAPRTITLTSETGQAHTIQVGTRPPVRITSVNGQGREGATVDLSQPLTIELDRQATDDTIIRIRLLGSTMGVRTFQDVLTVAGKSRIALPSDWARHTLRGRGYDKGESWLAIDEFSRTDFEDVAAGGMQVVTPTASDAVPVVVTGEFDRFAALTGLGPEVEGELYTDSGDGFKWFATKPIAFTGNAMLPGKKLAVVTFSVRATELYQSETTERSQTVGDVEYTTTTTRTRQFAQLPDAFWDHLVNGLHSDVMGTMQQHWQHQVIPVSQVVNSARYQNYPAVEEENTAVAVERSYQGLRTIFGQSLGDLFTDTTGPFATAEMERLMDDLGVDGLIAVTLDLQMPFEEFSLSPRLGFHVFGREPMPGVAGGGAALYAQGWVQGQGQPVTNEMLEDPEQLAAFLPTAINQTALLQAFDDAFAALKAKEESLPTYRAVWEGR